MKQQEPATPKVPDTEEPVPPPTEWDVSFGVTALGAVNAHIISAAPGEVKSVFILLATTLAWLYPGPGETLALREVARLRHELFSARAYFTDHDGEPCGVGADDAADVVAALDAALGERGGK